MFLDFVESFARHVQTLQNREDFNLILKLTANMSSIANIWQLMKQIFRLMEDRPAWQKMVLYIV